MSCSISPAWRVFGPPPNGHSKLLAFGLTAMINQPFDYLCTVGDDFHSYWVDNHRPFIDADARVDPHVERAVRSYHGTGGIASGGVGFLRWWGDWIALKGWMVVVLLLAPWD